MQIFSLVVSSHAIVNWLLREVSFAINFVTIVTDVKHHLQYYFQSIYIEKLLLINLFKVAIANW